MAVPAHDERDFGFAKKYGLSIPVVIAPDDWDGEATDPALCWRGTYGKFRAIRWFVRCMMEKMQWPMIWNPEALASEKSIIAFTIG